MKELVEKLLFLARGDNNTLTLHMESIPLDRLVREIARETAMIDPNHVFRISREDPVAVTADAQLLKQAVRILIDNSIKYTPPGGEITIGCTGNAGNEVRLLVQDSGAGIRAADVPSFSTGFIGPILRVRAKPADGLGLSIAKWIVERHNGRIEVLSREGYGTRMSVILPRLVNPGRSSGGAGVTPDVPGIAAEGRAEVQEHPVPPASCIDLWLSDRYSERQPDLV
jgi:signal transduction histidine kinase